MHGIFFDHGATNCAVHDQPLIESDRRERDLRQHRRKADRHPRRCPPNFGLGRRILEFGDAQPGFRNRNEYQFYFSFQTHANHAWADRVEQWRFEP
jgi:hypothetical protein